MEKHKAHVAEYKKKIVADIVKLLKSYPIIGVLNMENLPASALQVMRSKLRKDVTIAMTKRRLILHAIDEAKANVNGLDDLKNHLKGMPALLFTKENPFKLYKTIAQSKSPAAAKPGQTAPMNIIIPAGPTAFAPGPIIGELATFGIKSKVEAGKIAIVTDTVVVKEGEAIKPKVAELLLRFGIQPMEIGLDLTCVLENGVIYDKKVLAIDEKKFVADLEKAAAWAFNLAVESAYAAKDTSDILITKAFREAKAVALEGNIMCDMLAAELIEKAERQMNALKEEAKIDEAMASPPKEEPKPKEEKKEDKKEEPKLAEPKKEHHEVPKPEAPKAEVKPEHKQEMPKEEAKPEVPKEEKKEEHNHAEPAKKEEPKQEVKPEPVPEQPKAAEPIKVVETKVKLTPAPSSIKEVKVHNPEPVTQIKRTVSAEKAKETKQGENLFEELKKRGTLRGIEQPKQNTPKPLSPMDIVKRANKEL